MPCKSSVLHSVLGVSRLAEFRVTRKCQFHSLQLSLTSLLAPAYATKLVQVAWELATHPFEVSWSPERPSFGTSLPKSALSLASTAAWLGTYDDAKF